MTAVKGFTCNLRVVSGASALHSQNIVGAHLNTTGGGNNLFARSVIVEATSTSVVLTNDAKSTDNTGWCVSLLDGQ